MSTVMRLALVGSSVLAVQLAACEATERDGATDDPARQILDGARRALGAPESPTLLQVMADASVEGPGASFRTRIHSSSDGRVRMEQTPQGFVAGVGRGGAWRVEPATGRLDTLGPDLAFVRGHELHMLALAPRSRLTAPRFLGSTRVDGDVVLAVSMSMAGGDSLVAWFGRADTLPLGFRVMWTDPPVDVRWFGWSDRGGVRIFENAIFRQGTEEFRYTFDTIRLGPIPDSMFEPGPDN